MKRSSVFVLCLGVLFLNCVSEKIERSDIVGTYHLVPEKKPFYKRWFESRNPITGWDYNSCEETDFRLFSDSTYTDARRSGDFEGGTYSGKWKLRGDSVILFSIQFKPCADCDSSGVKTFLPDHENILIVKSGHRLKIVVLDGMEKGRFLKRE